MKKHIYRATNVKKINWDKVVEATDKQALVLGIDLAKSEQFAMLMDQEHSVYFCVKWKHPQETPLLLTGLKKLSFSRLEIAMEPTGVYGDTLRNQLKQAGYLVTQIATKRVHDSTEVYDGVPSQHDAKSAYLIARLYWEQVGKEWRELSDRQRECNALCQLYDNYDEHITRTRNRLEAKLQRHWPELPQCLDTKSITLEQLLIEYGSPATFMADETAARQLMRKASRGHLSQEKIEGLIEASRESIGIECIELERWQIQQLGEELQYFRLKKKGVQQQLEALVDSDTQSQAMGTVIGKVTTAMLLSHRLDPSDYFSAGAYVKAIGLNLKEKSSGQHKGQLKITKRGSAQARKYVYLAVLRLIHLNPVMKRWYNNKLRQHGEKNKKRWLTALMRKLMRGLWHVGQGACFDANKLFTMKGVA